MQDSQLHHDVFAVAAASAVAAAGQAAGSSPVRRAVQASALVVADAVARRQHVEHPDQPGRPQAVRYIGKLV